MDIVEDNRIPIILGRPMLSTAHTKFDVFARKMTLEANGEVATFRENELFSIPKKICVVDHNGDFGNALEEFLNETPKIPSKPDDFSSGKDFDVFVNFEEEEESLGISPDDFSSDIDMVPWHNNHEETFSPSDRPMFFEMGTRIHHRNPYNLQISCKIGFIDFHPFIDMNSPVNIMSKDCYNQIMMKELEYKGNNFFGIITNVHVFVGMHTFLADFVVLDDISEFVEYGLHDVILGKPFKNIFGLDGDAMNGIGWLKIGNDKTIFKMPRTIPNFKKWTKKQLSHARPLLEISEEDKVNGVKHPHQKIRNFYMGCLKLGDEYKKDEALIKWIQRYRRNDK